MEWLGDKIFTSVALDSYVVCCGVKVNDTIGDRKVIM